MKFNVCISVFLSALLAFAASAAEYKRVIHVDPSGNGDFRTISESFEAIRAYMDYDVTVYIANGVYYEKVVVPSWIKNVTFIGENPDSTIIRWADHAKIDNMGTFRTFTVRVDGDDLTFMNLTIENAAPRVAQAVALHTEGDRLTFVNCRFLGDQDTVFTGGEYTTLWFDHCYIEGTTDFIFGAATAYFVDCDIFCKSNSYITAASTPIDVELGYVFYDCRISAAPEVNKLYLGRPWRPYASTVFIDCVMDAPICPQGWHNWNDSANELTARYAEYGSKGAYGDMSQRAPWASSLNDSQASLIKRSIASRRF